MARGTEGPREPAERAGGGEESETAWRDCIACSVQASTLMALADESELWALAFLVGKMAIIASMRVEFGDYVQTRRSTWWIFKSEKEQN